MDEERWPPPVFSLTPAIAAISALVFQKNSHWGTGVASKVSGFISAGEKAEVGSVFSPQKVARLSERHRETLALGLGVLVNSVYFSSHQSVLSSQCCDKYLDPKQLGDEAGTEAEVVEEHCLRACSPWLAQSVFLNYLGLWARVATPAG